MTLALEEVACALCGHDTGQPILVGTDFEYGLDGEFSIAECQRCGHFYLNPRPAATEMSVLYPDHYVPFATVERKTSGRVARARRRVEELIQFGETIRSGQGKRLIEIGCGAGALLERFAEQGWDTIGIEPSGSAAKSASERGLNVMQGTDELLESLDEGSFDRLHAFMVIEHTPSPVETLRRLRRVAKDGATLCISVPNFDHASRVKFGEYWHALQLPRHFHHFTPESIDRLLRTAGWDVTRIWYQPTLTDTWQSLGHQSRHAGKADWRLRFVRVRRLIDVAVLPVLFWLAQRRGSSRMTVTATRSGD